MKSKKIFFEIPLPKTKRIVVEIIYHLDQSNFLEILQKNFRSINTDLKDTLFVILRRH